MGVSADAPYVDSVYKLVEYAGRPVLKLSAEKATAPGAKQVFRIVRDDAFVGDVIGLRDESAPAGAAPLLERMMAGGERLGPRGSLREASATFEADLAALPEDATAIRRPVAPVAGISPALGALTDRVRREMAARIGRHGPSDL
jgi:nicotinate phosphoribosyltransferase